MFDSVAVASLFQKAFNPTNRTFDFQLFTNSEGLRFEDCSEDNNRVKLELVD